MTRCFVNLLDEDISVSGKNYQEVPNILKSELYISCRIDVKINSNKVVLVLSSPQQKQTVSSIWTENSMKIS